MEFIPVNEPLLDGNERIYLNECIDSGWISSEGPFVTKFEELFSGRCNRSYGVAVSNGTAAIDAAINALEIGPGDEVIVPAFTIISCVSQIVRNGAIPVLVDCDPNSWNMDISQIEEKITPRTKAIMAVHIYGLPVDMDPLLELAKRYGLKVIEDAAEVHGQTYKGRPCGSFGDISIFSFYSNKHITTGEGGMILTNSLHLAERCRSIRNLFFQPEQRFVHNELGWNLRMTNLQAAVGLAQLERLDEFVLKKRKMGARYYELLKDIKGIKHPLQRTEFAENIYWVYGLVLDSIDNACGKKIITELEKKGVGSRPFFYTLNKQPVLKKMGLFEGEEYPVATNLSRNGFYLPSGMALTDQQMDKVSNALHDILRSINK